MTNRIFKGYSPRDLDATAAHIRRSIAAKQKAKKKVPPHLIATLNLIKKELEQATI